MKHTNMDYEEKYKQASEHARVEILANPGLRKIWEEIIDFIQWSEDRGITRHDYHQAKRPAVWIAYLEKQKEQKPVEWSEEDEKMRNALWNLLHLHYSQDYAPTLVGIEAGKFRNWLKSLRPHWKPSEEQMEALKTAIHIFPVDAKNRKELESLKAQLKKLI